MRTTWAAIALCLGVGATLAGCGSKDDPAPRAAASPVAGCANLEGGLCLNRLRPGKTYLTSQFRPAIAYSVRTTGWSNDEDLPGNFLLVPPGNDLPGVNAGTSDFIGVYSSITASRFTDLDGCRTAPIASVPTTPRGFVTWMQQQPVLAVSPPRPVTISGRSGLVTDVRLAAGRTPPTCTDDGTKVAVALLFSGLSPSSLDHGVIADMTMRLYLLRDGDRLMVVEVDDIDAAPGDLTSLSAQVQLLRFAA